MVGFSTHQAFSFNRKCWWHVLTRAHAGTLYWELKLWLVDNPPPLNDAYFNWSSRLDELSIYPTVPLISQTTFAV